MKYLFIVIRVLRFSNWLLLGLHPVNKIKKWKDSFPEVQGNQQVPSHAPAIPLPQRGLDMAPGEPGAMNKDLKFYYLHLLSEAEPVCRFTARVNRKFMFTSFQEKKPQHSCPMG